MQSTRSKRLVAAVLLLLLVGWAVRQWRSRAIASDVEFVLPPSLDDVPARETEQPRE